MPIAGRRTAFSAVWAGSKGLLGILIRRGRRGYSRRSLRSTIHGRSEMWGSCDCSGWRIKGIRIIVRSPFMDQWGYVSGGAVLGRRAPIEDSLWIRSYQTRDRALLSVRAWKWRHWLCIVVIELRARSWLRMRVGLIWQRLWLVLRHPKHGEQLLP